MGVSRDAAAVSYAPRPELEKHHQQAFAPNFQIEAVIDDRDVGAGDFHLRMITVNDLVKDYDAVMSSVPRLKGSMRPGSSWPEGLTLEDDLIDLGWHQREFRLRRSFCYTMMTPDESICLGACYIYQSEKSGYDAKAFWWVRTSAVADGFDERLGAALRGWLRDAWPFKRVAFPGRDISWDQWRAATCRCRNCKVVLRHRPLGVVLTGRSIADVSARPDAARCPL